jgi:16S rRNA (adenine1518-N6/adenine1519-N6)-dimethyltransferase
VLVVLERHGPAPERALRRLVQQSFAHRRKALARSLQLGPRATPELRERVRAVLVEMGHPADERAERLEPEEFRALHEALRA